MFRAVSDILKLSTMQINMADLTCCDGVVHAGVVRGEERTLGELNCYFASPAAGSSAQGAILFLTDIHGWQLPNNRLLADRYAAAGFAVFIPDMFQGDPMQREPGRGGGGRAGGRGAGWSDPNVSEEEKAAQRAKMEAWRAKHGDAVVLPLISATVALIRAEGHAKVGAVGFCWGGRYSVLVAGESSGPPLVDAFCAAHPSRVALPGDVSAISVAGLWCVAENDHMFGPAQMEEARGLMAARPTVPVTFKVYPGTGHGFAVRGDADTDAQRAECAQDVVAFFKSVLSV